MSDQFVPRKELPLEDVMPGSARQKGLVNDIAKYLDMNLAAMGMMVKPSWVYEVALNM